MQEMVKDELQELRTLAGIGNRPDWTAVTGSNISITGNEKAQLMKKHDIRPGTEAWFKLWYSLPKMTGITGTEGL
jgi:hypothetical protein